MKPKSTEIYSVFLIHVKPPFLTEPEGVEEMDQYHTAVRIAQYRVIVR